MALFAFMISVEQFPCLDMSEMNAKLQSVIYQLILTMNMIVLYVYEVEGCDLL